MINGWRQSFVGGLFVATLAAAACTGSGAGSTADAALPGDALTDRSESVDAPLDNGQDSNSLDAAGDHGVAPDDAPDAGPAPPTDAGALPDVAVTSDASCGRTDAPPRPFEVCDNGLDDDCNGAVDEVPLCGLPCTAPVLVGPAGDPGREPPIDARPSDRLCFRFTRSGCRNQVHYLKVRACAGVNCAEPLGAPVLDREVNPAAGGDNPTITEDCVTLDSRFAPGQQYRWVVYVRPRGSDDPRYSPQYRVFRVTM